MSRLFIVWISVLTIFAESVCAQEADGLLADVFTTSGDNFTIELRHDAAPRTVAHFMRLASGNQPWLDHASGTIVTGIPYYPGTKFQSFQSQGLPNRSYLQVGERKDPIGTEGPGYVLRDGIRRYGNGAGALILPHSSYTVTMANTGAHSSGGQFIITLVADPQFDDRNSAFGIVRSLFYTYNAQGQAISVSNGRLAVNNIFNSTGQVSISSISFRRRGLGAVGFDETQLWGELPLMGKVPIISVAHTLTDAILQHPSQVGGFYRAYGSVDLINWSYVPSFDDYHGPGVGASSSLLFSHGGLPKAFFQLIGVQYPMTTVPQNLFGKIITIGLGTPHAIRFEFNAIGGAAYYRYSDQSVGELIYDYKVTGPYSAELHVTSPDLDEATYTLYFGGKNLAVSTNETMSAEIEYSGFNAFESHFTMLP